MRDAISLFKPAFGYLFKSKLNTFLTIIPVILGIALYALLGKWVYSNLLSYGEAYISSYMSEGTLGSVVYYIIATILTALLFLIINWTFVLVITIFASPFNDLLSSRIEKMENGVSVESGEGWSKLLGKLVSTLWNELKKVILILIFSILGFILGYIPFLVPLSFLITVVLLAVNFIDYSWSRHDIPSKECFKDVRRNLWSYGIGGVFFFVLVSIPIVNLLVAPFATSYFTLLWLKRNERYAQITK